MWLLIWFWENVVGPACCVALMALDAVFDPLDEENDP